MSKLKKQITEAMKKIVIRKPGRSRLVYDKATRIIYCVDDQTKARKPTSLIIHEDDADVFGILP
jgi:hypothetical protein